MELKTSQVKVQKASLKPKKKLSVISKLLIPRFVQTLVLEKKLAGALRLAIDEPMLFFYALIGSHGLSFARL